MEKKGAGPFAKIVILQPMVSKMEGLLFLILQETIFVIDIVWWGCMQNALLLLTLLAQSEADIAKGKVIRQQDLFDALERELEAGRYRNLCGSAIVMQAWLRHSPCMVLRAGAWSPLEGVA